MFFASLAVNCSLREGSVSIHEYLSVKSVTHSNGTWDKLFATAFVYQGPQFAFREENTLELASHLDGHEKC